MSAETPTRSSLIVDTPLISVNAHKHSSEPHVDPSEEQFTGYHLIFTETGRWHYRDRDARAEINPRMAILALPGRFYSCRHEEEIPSDCCIDIQFKKPSLLEDPRQVRVTVLRANPRLIMLKERIKRLADAAEDVLNIDEVGQELLAELTTSVGEGRRPELPLRTRHRDSVCAAKEFIEEHFADRLQLHDLASSVGLSPFHFSRMFKKQTGHSPYSYLRDLRLKRAARLLRQSSLPVTDIAYDVGFESLSLFINSFRAHFGKPPSAYRK
ncbi:MAG: helix-turn-helix transcriptional regulator [Elusimicrobia bacterium]|nr:helix-turn-helix transcriptional regulator [Elusimicrobiota bacterium]